jgi:hypothetical protein
LQLVARIEVWHHWKEASHEATKDTKIILPELVERLLRALRVFVALWPRPALSEGVMYVRTAASLFAIGRKP